MSSCQAVARDRFVADDLCTRRWLRYNHLISLSSGGELLDVHLFASVMAVRWEERGSLLAQDLGMSYQAYSAFLHLYFPAMAHGHQNQASRLASSLEEEMADLRALLLEYRAGVDQAEYWLASIIARTALRPNHLWEDFGVAHRGEISAMLQRHFPALAEKNIGSKMRWKKFLYKQLCQRAEISLCRAPNCQDCGEFRACFATDQIEQDRTVGLVWAPLRG